MPYCSSLFPVKIRFFIYLPYRGLSCAQAVCLVLAWRYAYHMHLLLSSLRLFISMDSTPPPPTLPTHLVWSPISYLLFQLRGTSFRRGLRRICHTTSIPGPCAGSGVADITMQFPRLRSSSIASLWTNTSSTVRTRSDACPHTCSFRFIDGVLKDGGEGPNTHLAATPV